MVCPMICLQGAPNVFPAREFVWWYNGHPDCRELPVDLSQVESVAVCGIGNVALDCARLLLRSPADLAPTDLARHALEQLQGGSRVREVHLIARRGPVQVSPPGNTAGGPRHHAGPPRAP